MKKLIGMTLDFILQLTFKNYNFSGLAENYVQLAAKGIKIKTLLPTIYPCVATFLCMLRPKEILYQLAQRSRKYK